MTIYYESSDHLRVMMATTGTIWREVLPFCIWSAVAYLVVARILPEYADIDIRIESGSSSDTLTLLVSFLVVMRFDAEFGTFCAAATEFYHILGDCHLVASYAHNFTAADTSPKANEWRRMMRKALNEFVIAACDSVQDDDMMCRIFEGQPLPDDPDPLTLAENVHDCIILHKNYILGEHQLTIHHEMLLHHFTTKMLDEYVEVGKFKETPTPYPLVQVCRTILYCYLLALPLFLSEDFNFANIFSMFFACYGLFGLELVSDEIGDPFGEDDNDIDIQKLKNHTVWHIDHLLSGDSAKYLRELERAHSYRPGLYEKNPVILTQKSVRPPRLVKDIETLEIAKNDAERFCFLGKDEMAMRNFEASLDYYKRALKEGPQPTVACTILELMGDAYSALELHEKALERYQEGLRMKRKTKMMVLLIKIANSFFAQGEYEKSLGIYCQALPLKSVEEGWDSDEVAQIYMRIGLIQFESGNSDLALDHLWHALRAKRKRSLAKDDQNYWAALQERMSTSNEQQMATILFIMGVIHEERCEFEWALTYFTECLAAQQRHPPQGFTINPDCVHTYMHIGSVHYKCNRRDQAQENYQRALYTKRHIEAGADDDSSEVVYSTIENKWNEEAMRIWMGKRYIYPGSETIYDYHEGNTSTESEQSNMKRPQLERTAPSKKLPQALGTAPTGSESHESWSVME